MSKTEQPPKDRRPAITHLSFDLYSWCVSCAVAENKSLGAWIRHRLSVLRADEENNPDFLED